MDFCAFSPCGPTLLDIFGLNKISSFECEEIIPLTLCSDCEILRAQYPNVHSSVAGYSIPDDEWHAVYLEVCLEFRGQEVRHKLLYLHMENLLCFEQVFQAHQIPIDVLYAKRVEGKSGSWEFIHSEESQIMQSIGQAPVDASQDFGRRTVQNLPETANVYLDLPVGISRLGVRSSQKIQIGVG